MQDAYGAIVVINREEDAVRVRLPAVRQYSDGLIGVDALERDGTLLRMLVEREDCAFETPCRICVASAATHRLTRRRRCVARRAIIGATLARPQRMKLPKWSERLTSSPSKDPF